MPDAILATYSDWRPVKSRKALQLVFEVPLERQEEVLRILGAPLPDREQWVGIALVNKAAAEAPPKDEARSERARERFAMLPDGEQAVAKCAMRCGDAQFQRWLGAHDERECVTLLYRRLRIASRREIGADARILARWQALETDYLMDTGQMARPA